MRLYIKITFFIIFFIIFFIYFISIAFSMDDKAEIEYKNLPIIEHFQQKNSCRFNAETTDKYYISKVDIEKGIVQSSIHFNKNVKIPFPFETKISFLESTPTTLTISYFSPKKDHIIIHTLDLTEYHKQMNLKKANFRLIPKSMDSAFRFSASDDKNNVHPNLFSLWYKRESFNCNTNTHSWSKTLLIENINFNESPCFNSIQVKDNVGFRTQYKPLPKRDKNILLYIVSIGFFVIGFIISIYFK